MWAERSAGESSMVWRCSWCFGSQERLIDSIRTALATARLDTRSSPVRAFRIVISTNSRRFAGVRGNGRRFLLAPRAMATILFSCTGVR